MGNTVLPSLQRQLLRMKSKIVIILFESTMNLLTCYSKTLNPFSFFFFFVITLIVLAQLLLIFIVHTHIQNTRFTVHFLTNSFQFYFVQLILIEGQLLVISQSYVKLKEGVQNKKSCQTWMTCQRLHKKYLQVLNLSK